MGVPCLTPLSSQDMKCNWTWLWDRGAMGLWAHVADSLPPSPPGREVQQELGGAVVQWGGCGAVSRPRLTPLCPQDVKCNGHWLWRLWGGHGAVWGGRGHGAVWEPNG